MVVELRSNLLQKTIKMLYRIDWASLTVKVAWIQSWKYNNKSTCTYDWIISIASQYLRLDHFYCITNNITCLLEIIADMYKINFVHFWTTKVKISYLPHIFSCIYFVHNWFLNKLYSTNLLITVLLYMQSRVLSSCNDSIVQIISFIASFLWLSIHIHDLCCG